MQGIINFRSALNLGDRREVATFIGAVLRRMDGRSLKFTLIAIYIYSYYHYGAYQDFTYISGANPGGKTVCPSIALDNTTECLIPKVPYYSSMSKRSQFSRRQERLRRVYPSKGGTPQSRCHVKIGPPNSTRLQPWRVFFAPRNMTLLVLFHTRVAERY